MSVHVIVFTPPLEKFNLMKWQWYKEKPLLFKIYNSSLSSEGKSNQSTYSIYKERFPAEWAYQSSHTAALLLCTRRIVVSIQHAHQHTWCNQANKRRGHLQSRETNSNYDFCYVSLVHPFVLLQSHGYGKQFNLYVGDEEAFVDGGKYLNPHFTPPPPRRAGLFIFQPLLFYGTVEAWVFFLFTNLHINRLVFVQATVNVPPCVPDENLHECLTLPPSSQSAPLATRAQTFHSFFMRQNHKSPEVPRESRL